MREDTNLDVNLSPYRPFQFNCDSDQRRQLRQWLSELDTLPHSPLQIRPKLGIYFEELVAFFLTQNPVSRYRVLARNLQLFEALHQGRQTLGELDFVLDQEQNTPESHTLWHLETAVKFYLACDRLTGQWLGPDPTDSLASKCARMKLHQLPLGQHLPSLSASTTTDITSRYWLKGLLFYHWHNVPQRHSAAYRWLRRVELPNFFASEGNDWHLLERNRWLGGIHEESDPVDSDCRDDRIQYLMDARQAVMLGKVAADARIMVVGNDWPTFY